MQRVTTTAVAACRATRGYGGNTILPHADDWWGLIRTTPRPRHVSERSSGQSNQPIANHSRRKGDEHKLCAYTIAFLFKSSPTTCTSVPFSRTPVPFSCTSVPFSRTPVLYIFALWCPTILVFFAPRCPILLTPPLALGGKMAGNAGDSIVSEEHCKLLDHVQAGC